MSKDHATWLSHRDICVLLVPISPISKGSFDRVSHKVKSACGGNISIDSILPDSWSIGDSPFEHLSRHCGTVKCAVISSLAVSTRGANRLEHEPHRKMPRDSWGGPLLFYLGRIRIAIGVKSRKQCENIFDADIVASKFASAQGVDSAHIVSIGLYVDSDDQLHILQGGTPTSIGSHDLDETIRSVVSRAYLKLLAEAKKWHAAPQL